MQTAGVGSCLNGLPVLNGLLLDRIAKSLSVVPDPCVARHDRDQLRRFIEQLRRSQVHCIERPNGFHREWSAHASEDDAIDVNDEATAFECPQSPNGCLFLGDCQPRGTCADDRSCGFCEGQGGGHVPPVGLQGCQRNRVVFQ